MGGERVGIPPQFRDELHLPGNSHSENLHMLKVLYRNDSNSMEAAFIEKLKESSL